MSSTSPPFGLNLPAFLLYVVAFNLSSSMCAFMILAYLCEGVPRIYQKVIGRRFRIRVSVLLGTGLPSFCLAIWVLLALLAEATPSFAWVLKGELALVAVSMPSIYCGSLLGTLVLRKQAH